MDVNIKNFFEFRQKPTVFMQPILSYRCPKTPAQHDPGLPYNSTINDRFFSIWAAFQPKNQQITRRQTHNEKKKTDMKLYADQKRSLKLSKIKVGDSVLI